MEDALRSFLDSAEDWEKLPTEIADIDVVKMKGTKNRPPLLCIEVNPKRKKRKGLFVTSSEMLVDFSELLSNEAVFNLMKTIDNINSEVSPAQNSSQKKLKLE